MEFGKLINQEIQEENTELTKKLEKSLKKIEYYELEISGKKVNKKFKKYSKLYNKMVELHVQLNSAKDEVESKLKEVDDSVTTIQTINKINKFVADGDSVLKSNAKLAKGTYQKALELSQTLMGIELVNNEDVQFIQDKIDLAESVQATEETKSTMSYISSFLSDGNERMLGLSIRKVKDLNFTKVNAMDKELIQKLITKVLNEHPDQLGSLVQNIQSNKTAIELNLEIKIPLFN